MTYVLTYQSGLHERPTVRSFDTREEAEEVVEQLKIWVEEKRVPWKIEPTIRPEQ